MNILSFTGSKGIINYRVVEEKIFFQKFRKNFTNNLILRLAKNVLHFRENFATNEIEIWSNFVILRNMIFKLPSYNYFEDKSNQNSFW